MKRWITKAAGLGTAVGLVTLLAISAEGADSLSDTIRKAAVELGAGSLEAREKASAGLSRLLEELAGARDREALHRALLEVAELERKADDPETRNRLSRLQHPFQGGYSFWERKDLPGSKLDTFRVVGKNVLAGGWGLPDMGCWLGGYDLAGGGTVWEKAKVSFPGWINALDAQEELFFVGGERGYVESYMSDTPCGGLGAYKAKTGEPAWEKEAKDLPGGVQFVKAHGWFLLAGGVAPLPAGQEKKENAHSVVCWLAAYDPRSGKVIWERRGGDLRAGWPQVSGKKLLAVGNGLTVYDVETGKTVWERKGDELPTRFIHAAQLQGDAVFIAGAPGGKFVGASSWMVCYDAATGKTVWEKSAKEAWEKEETPGEIRVLRVEENRLFAGGHHGWMGAYDAKTGKALWQMKGRELPGAVCALEFFGDRLAAGGAVMKPAGWLGVYEAGTGKIIWEKKAGDVPGAVQSVHVEGNRLVAGGGWDIDTQAWLGCYRLEGELESRVGK